MTVTPSVATPRDTNLSDAPEVNVSDRSCTVGGTLQCVPHGRTRDSEAFLTLSQSGNCDALQLEAARRFACRFQSEGKVKGKRGFV